MTRNGRIGSTPIRGTSDLIEQVAFFMRYCVYILYSKKLNRYYIGTTDDLQKRFTEHNSAHYSDSFSVKGIPWEIFLEITCESSTQAYNLEKFIKRMKSRSFIERLKSNPAVIVDLLIKTRK